MAAAFRSASKSASLYLEDPVCAKPAGTVDGDMLVAVVSNYDETGGHGVTWPDNWIELGLSFRAPGDSHRMEVRYKIAAGEPANYTFTLTGSGDREAHVSMIAISGAGEIAGTTGIAEPFAASNLVGVSSVTTLHADDLLVAILSGLPTAVPIPTWTPASSGYTERIEGGNADNAMSNVIYTKEPAGVVGPTGTVTFGTTLNWRNLVAHLAISSAVAAISRPRITWDPRVIPGL